MKSNERGKISEKIKEWFWDFGEYAFGMEVNTHKEDERAIAFRIRIHLFLFFSVTFVLRYYLDGFVSVRFTFFGIYFELVAGKSSLLTSYPTELFYKKLGFDPEKYTNDN